MKTLNAVTLAKLIQAHREPGRADISIAGAIRKIIRERLVDEGVLFPTTGELARVLHANLNSVNRALQVLSVEGHLVRSQKKGTVVAQSKEELRNVLVLFGALLNESVYIERYLRSRIEYELALRGYTAVVVDGLSALSVPDPSRQEVAIERFLEIVKDRTFVASIEIGYIALRCHSVLQNYIMLPTAAYRPYGLTPGEVRFDWDEMLRMILCHFKQKGCQRILLVNTTPFIGADRALLNSFWHNIRVYQLECAGVVEVLDREQALHRAIDCREKMNAVLERWKCTPKPFRFDAIVTTNFDAGIGIANALIDHGIEVPKDLRFAAPAIKGESYYEGIAVDRLEKPIGKISKYLIETMYDFIVAPTRVHGQRVVPAVMRPHQG